MTDTEKINMLCDIIIKIVAKTYNSFADESEMVETYEKINQIKQNNKLKTP